MSSSKHSVLMEFAVKLNCKSCVNKIEESLKEIDGVNNFEVSLEKGTVLVETNLPSSVVQHKIESTGILAVLKGYGSKIGGGDIAVGQPLISRAAVAMLGGTIGYGLGVKGIVRFVDSEDQDCVIDGTIDGLTPGKHGLHIHQCGDISQGCESVGDHYNPFETSHGGPQDDKMSRHVGDLGNITANNDGRATFRFKDALVNVPDVIGRCIVVTETEDDLGKSNDAQSKIDGKSGKRLACGIISRSAGLFENSKKICACDGVTIWDERNKPLAGGNRSNKSVG